MNDAILFPFIQAAELRDEVDPTRSWVPVLPVGPMWLEDEETGEFRKYMVTLELLEAARSEYRRYLADCKERGTEGEEACRPVIPGHDIQAVESYGAILDVEIKPHRGEDWLWFHLSEHRKMGTRQVSISLKPEWKDPFTGGTYSPFIHHLGVTAFPKFKPAVIPTDPAVWESVGLVASESHREEVMSKKTTKKPEAEEVETQAAEETTEEAEEVEAEETEEDAAEGEEGEMTDEEFREGVMTTLGELTDTVADLSSRLATLEEGMTAMEEEEEEEIEASETKPSLRSRFSEMNERIANLEGLASRTTKLNASEQGSTGKAPAKPIRLTAEQAIEASERALKGKSDDVSDVIALSRLKQGQQISDDKKARLQDLGVA